MLESKKSHVDLNRFVSADMPLVSLVRKKGTEHAFLIVERLKDDEIEMVQVDLFVNGDKPVFKSSGFYISGESLIVPQLITLEELEKYNKRGFFVQSFSTDNEKCEGLLKKVLEDSQREDIKYSSLGDGSFYKISSSHSKEQHSCTTYLTELLKTALDVHVGSSWLDFFIVLPSKIVPGDDKTGCYIL